MKREPDERSSKSTADGATAACSQDGVTGTRHPTWKSHNLDKIREMTDLRALDTETKVIPMRQKQSWQALGPPQRT